jgi:hypothetical protein
MNPTEIITVEQLAFDGPIGLPLTFIAALILLALFAWSLYHEEPVLGLRTAVGFGILRFFAVATVLWMLLAPTSVVVETASTRKAVALITDVSGSMWTADPIGTADELRWAIAGDQLPSHNSAASPPTAAASLAPSPTEAADQAVAAMGIARRGLLAAIDALMHHRSDTSVSEHALASQAAIDRAKLSLDRIGRASALTGGDEAELSSVLQSATEARTLLDGPEFQSFAELCQILAKGRMPSGTGWRESLPDLEPRMVAIRNHMQDLSRSLALIETAMTSSQAPTQWGQVSQSTRIQRVAAVLENLKRSTLDAISSDVDVQWSRFDTTFSPAIDPQLQQEGLMPFLIGGHSNNASAAATNLSSALEHVQRLEQQQPIAAAFIFTDANHNDVGSLHVVRGDSADTPVVDEGTVVQEPTKVAANITNTPVYVVPIGNTRRLRDLALVGVEAPPVAMRNDDIVIEAHVEAYQCDGERCVVRLLSGGEVVDFRELTIDSDFASRTIRFIQRVPDVGEQAFQIAIEPIDGEVTEENNYQSIEVNVTRSDIKLLLADELPRWEYRYLAQLFRRDPKVECDEMLFRPRMIATGRREESRTFPVTVDQWDQYDVVILGDIPPEHLSIASQESLVEYLQQRGGTLVMIAGERAMPHQYARNPLEQIVPVQPIDSSAEAELGTRDGYAFQVTEEGQSHIALMIGENQQATRTAWDFVNRFTPLHDLSAWRKPKPTARNLIAAVPRQGSADGSDMQNSTFLCWQPIGRGRIVYLSGPDTYRLRFLRGDQLHYRFWGQLLRWAIASDLATGSKYVRLRSHKTRYDLAEPIHIEVQLFGAEGQPIADAVDLQLHVTSSGDDKMVPLVVDPERPGTYVAVFKTSKSGDYRARPVGAAIQSLMQIEGEEVSDVPFTVHASVPMELVDTRSNRVLASQISDLTGGQVLPPTAVSEILALTDLAPVVTETVERQPLWDLWKYLWLVFSCLQIEWAIRKWRGLS